LRWDDRTRATALIRFAGDSTADHARHCGNRIQHDRSMAVTFGKELVGDGAKNLDEAKGDPIGERLWVAAGRASAPTQNIQCLKSQLLSTHASARFDARVSLEIIVRPYAGARNIYLYVTSTFIEHGELNNHAMEVVAQKTHLVAAA
jgi:hypothetical protein